MNGARPVELADARDREIATREFGVNLVVTAGAGTGKTALLVERALNLIGSGVVTIDRLASVTFTEKAAAELRLRLGRGLDGLRRHAAAATPGNDLDHARDADRSWAFLQSSREEAGRVHQRALAALRGLDGAAIGTLHSLCSDILRRYPTEAGVDPAFAVDEGPAAGRQFPAEAERYLRSELGDSGRRTDVWRRAIGRRDGIDTVLGLASGLSEFSIPAGASPPSPSEARERLLPEVDGALAHLRDALGRGAPFPGKMQKTLEASETLLRAMQSGGYEALRSTPAAMSLEDLAALSTHNPGRKTSAADAEEGMAAARRACELLRLLARVDDGAVTALADAAAPLGGAARERLLATGFVSFDGLLRLTADLLRRSPAVRRALARRFERLLVDEFQDTDPLQYDILFFLAEREEGDPAGDPYRTRLQPGRLFIVGDPKQSIYRFRGADMAAFRRAVAHVEACGGRRLSLTASFRSPAGLLAPVNRLFRGWMGHAGDWQGDYEPPYEEITSARSGTPADGPRVEIWSVESEGGADAGRAAEADAIAAWIAAQRFSATGSGGPGLRQVAILLRALTNAGLYARALRRAGIPFVVDGGRDFGARPEVGDLLSFLRCVASPNDGPAMLAVLRSPLGAVSDAEMARFVRAGGRLAGDPDAAIDASRFPGLARVHAMVEEFRERMRAHPIDRLVEEALVDPPLALLHASAWDGAQRLANLAKLAALARRHAREGLSLQETLAALEEEFDGARTEGDSPLVDESLQAVRILSIHKAKGLEYPIVFVPDLGRAAGGDRREREVRVAWLRDGGGALAIRLPDGRSNSAWVSHAIETRRHEQAEEKRVLYVACTRAQERLILLNSSLERKAPWRDRLEALGYRIAAGPAFPPPGLLDEGRVEHRVVGRVVPPHAEAGAPALERIAGAAARHRLVVAAAAEKAGPPISWPSGTRAEDRSEPDETGAPDTDAALGRAAARLAGLAVHAALESWDCRDDEALLQGARVAVRRLSADFIDPEAGSGEAAAEAAAGDILRHFLRSPLRARLAQVEILGREVPILHRDASGRTWTGACDLLFRDGGTLIVADYKTDVVGNDPAAAAAIYRAQIDIYRRAVQAAFAGQEVRSEVWFLRTGAAIPF